VAVNPATHHAYVVNYDSDSVSVLDISRNADLDTHRHAHPRRSAPR